MSVAPLPRAGTDAGAPNADALAVEHLDVTYRVRGRDLTVLRDLSFQIDRGESFGLVGESGSGKSTVAMAVVRYLARNGRVSGGRIAIDGQDVLGLDREELRRLRASKVSMVYQEPGKALNPTIRVGRQVAEVFEIAGLPRAEAMERAEQMLAKVRISDPAGGHAALPPSALRRHAPAGGDRDGARRRTLAPDPRRADDSARRDRRGRGARPDRLPAPGVRRPRCCSSATTSR